MTTTTDIQKVAAEAYACFETAFRDPEDDSSSFVRVRDGSPEWVTDLVREAHGDMLPDDYRYAWVMNALECISEADDPEDAAHEFADAATDIYTGSLIAWLGSNLQRVGLVDEACFDLSVDASDGIVRMMQAGQYAEIREVFASVWRSLENRL